MNIFDERFEFRNIKKEEWEKAAELEQICFPPNEACTPEMMKIRVNNAPDLFIAAVDRNSGCFAGMIDGLATNETKFRDEFFTAEDLDDENGNNIMIMGVEVHPDYQRQGLARELMSRYASYMAGRGKTALYLTCLESKVPMYEKFGFKDLGWSDSVWGGEKWHEMSMNL